MSSTTSTDKPSAAFAPGGVTPNVAPSSPLPLPWGSSTDARLLQSNLWRFSSLGVVSFVARPDHAIIFSIGPGWTGVRATASVVSNLGLRKTRHQKIHPHKIQDKIVS